MKDGRPLSDLIELDEHSRRNQLHLADTPEYQELFEEYQEKYLEPIVGRSGLI